MTREECNRVWVCETGMGWCCHPRNCVFCDNCTDIFYDSNGPYMIICDKDLPQEIGFEGKCKQFFEENPAFITEEQYAKERAQAHVKAAKFIAEHKEEIDKIFKECWDEYTKDFANIKDIDLGDKPFQRRNN